MKKNGKHADPQRTPEVTMLRLQHVSGPLGISEFLGKVVRHF